MIELTDVVIIRRLNPAAGARAFYPQEIAVGELFEEFHKMSKARLLKETRVDHGMLVDTSSEDSQ